MCVAAWAARHLRRYVQYVPYTELVVADPALVVVATNPVVASDLAAWLLELNMYRVSWVLGADYLEVVTGVMSTAGLSGDWSDLQRQEPPRLQHEADFAIEKPEGRSMEVGCGICEGVPVAFFDGGAAQ